MTLREKLYEVLFPVPLEQGGDMKEHFPEVLDALESLITSEKKAAVEEARLETDTLRLELQLLKENVRIFHQQHEHLQKYFKPAMEELERLDYTTLKERVCLKNVVLREYFRVCSTFPS